MNRADCIREFGSEYMIKKQLDSGLLFQVGKAVYSKEKNVPYIAVLLFKYPNAVITMHSAFYIHGLTDVIPDYYDLATSRDAAKIHDKSVKQFFLPDEIYDLGIEMIDHKGYDIKIFNKERMLIELLRYKSKLPLDYYKEILLNYRKMIPNLNIQKIQDYAVIVPKHSHILEILQMEVF